MKVLKTQPGLPGLVDTGVAGAMARAVAAGGMGWSSHLLKEVRWDEMR